MSLHRLTPRSIECFEPSELDTIARAIRYGEIMLATCRFYEVSVAQKRRFALANRLRRPMHSAGLGLSFYNSRTFQPQQVGRIRPLHDDVHIPGSVEAHYTRTGSVGALFTIGRYAIGEELDTSTCLDLKDGQIILEPEQAHAIEDSWILPESPAGTLILWGDNPLVPGRTPAHQFYSLGDEPRISSFMPYIPKN